MVNMQNTIAEMFKLKNWAVVGATPNKEKYGNSVLNDLVNRGYNVYPVNPRYDEIEGMKTYPCILDIEDDVDCVSMVVNKEISRKVVEMAIKKKVKYIWFQPDTYDMDTIRLAEGSGIKVVHGTCVLLS